LVGKGMSEITSMAHGPLKLSTTSGDFLLLLFIIKI